MRKMHQEKPVKVNSILEKSYVFENYDRQQKLEFTCEKCQSIFELRVNAFLKRNNLLCSKCLHSENNNFKVEKSLFFNEFPKDKEISKTQKIKFYCVNCNKLSEVQYRNYSENKLCEHCAKSLHNKSGSLKVIEKRNKTCEEKYGKDWKKEINRKTQKTMIERYGSTTTMQSDELKKKVFEAQKEKYGGWALENKEIHQKTINSGKQKNSYSKSSFWKNKTEEELEKIIHKRNKRYTYEGVNFDSSWEVAFYIYCEDNKLKIEREKTILQYEDENKMLHKYIVDFTIGNELYEIKSNYLLASVDRNKLECMKNNNVIIINNKKIKKYIKYVKEKYGKNYIKDNFRNF